MSRQIVLDTETTGIGPGHRIIEIGGVELIERKLTGNHFHVYLNPERAVDDGAFRVHGISNEFLQDKPKFSEIRNEFIEFVTGSELIIHNAPFDVGFINAEFKRLKSKQMLEDCCSVLDTLLLAREMHPGQRNSLDALCKRYEIDNSKRDLHGALLDAEILAWVYLTMTGGQSAFSFDMLASKSDLGDPAKLDTSVHQDLSNQTPVIKAMEDEIKAHEEFIAFIVQSSGITH